MMILYSLLLAIIFNMAMFAGAFIFKTDKLTDISYSITFVLLTAFAASLGSLTLISTILCCMIALWALRLGVFLLMRIHRFKQDKRFDTIRGSFIKFSGFWLLQAISAWVILLPSLLVLEEVQSFSWIHIFGVAIWISGLLIETIADKQKYNYYQNPNNKKWIDKGLWAYSRHPNYFGEMVVWIGIYVFALPHLHGINVALGALSPLYIIGLLCFVSGIPILEKSADAKYKLDQEYWIYKKNTNILIPWYKKNR